MVLGSPRRKVRMVHCASRGSQLGFPLQGINQQRMCCHGKPACMWVRVPSIMALQRAPAHAVATALSTRVHGWAQLGIWVGLPLLHPSAAWAANSPSWLDGAQHPPQVRMPLQFARPPLLFADCRTSLGQPVHRLMLVVGVLKEPY